MSPESFLNIPESAELKALSNGQLVELAAAIRKRLIKVTSVNGGHLASSLGAVELILALHRVFDFPTDHLVFDVGHQAYAHKLVTGRQQAFDTLRTYGGISGFIRKEESPYDINDSGHASDSLSTALGLALARDLEHGTQRVAVLIGDAALSGGMAFEALNQIGHLQTEMTIVLNDNEMSIAPNVGALSLYLGRARTSKAYTTLRDTVEDRMASTGRLGRFLVRTGETAKESFKKLMVPGTFFEDMGIIYIGPIDGHNIETVSKALKASLKFKGPVLIHTITQKGRGYAPAEMQPELYHGVSCYDPKTGKFASKKGNCPTYTEVFSKALLEEAQQNSDIVAITAAMMEGTGLTPFSEAHPERFYDVGIAEEHAVALAGGFALGGKLPVVAIYSTFLQRAYDQLMINVALLDSHVVFAIDRAGIVGEDGTTHHGVFDLAYLRNIPNMRILAPADAQQLKDALHTALHLEGGPIALRYPRGAVLPPGDQEPADKGDMSADKGEMSADKSGLPQAGNAPLKREGDLGDKTRPARMLKVGQGVTLRQGADVSLLAVGRMVGKAMDAARILAERGIEAQVENMLWVKPLDVQAVARAAQTPLVVTLEEGTVLGGFGSAVLEALAQLGCEDKPADTRVLTLGVPDDFVKHGSIEELFEELGLNGPQIAERICDALRKEGQTD